VATNVVDRVALNFVVATSMQFLTVDVTSVAGYVAGSSDITITVNSSVFVYGYQPTKAFPSIQQPVTPFPLVASMQIIGGAAGDTIKLVNNGNIIGGGGDGAGVIEWFGCCCCPGAAPTAFLTNPAKGNAALSFITPGISLTIENNGAIAGGGGGGGIGSFGGNIPGGGGGAGGGISGLIGTNGNSAVRAIPPNGGNNGNTVQTPYGCGQSIYAIYGGGGGFVLSGAGGTVSGPGLNNFGLGGGAGGGGSSTSSTAVSTDNNGGSVNNPAPTYTLTSTIQQGGGGGGWGAAGAAGYAGTSLIQAGAPGGNSIVTNGNAYTLTGSGLLYGTVDTTIRSAVITYPTSNYAGTTLEMNTIPGFINGMNIVVIVPANVILASTSTAVGALTFTNLGTATQPSSVRVVINGYILAAGGRGASESNSAENGGAAIQLPSNVAPYYIIDNTNGYIAGGGGGGGRSLNGTSTITLYGGGGAGFGGSSGRVGNVAYNAGVSSGFSSGTNGQIAVSGNTFISGGSGGTILPGTRTTNPTSTTGNYVGLGGQNGGAGAYMVTSGTQAMGNYGGATLENGGNNQNLNTNAAGGGGGWGAQGGLSYRATIGLQSGGSPGRAVKISVSAFIYVTNSNNIIGTVGV
jgi:hypothetical protein